MSKNIKCELDFSGISTALITPFKNNKIDYAALEKLIEVQINSNIDAIVIAGTTGEVHSLDDYEYEELLRKSSEYTLNRIKLIAGVGFNNTLNCVKAANIAEKYSYDAVMAITPYCNKPSQAGLYEHYKTIHEQTNLPIIIYDAPSRACIGFQDATIIKLSELEKIVAYKDCSGNLYRPLTLNKDLQNKLQFLIGDDIDILTYSANGGVGCVSVLANILPLVVKDVYYNIKQNNYKLAQFIFANYAKLCKLLFIESNPAPVKYCMSLLKLCNEDLRLPLYNLSCENKHVIMNELINLKLIDE